MKELLLVFFGGGLGSMARFAIGNFFSKSEYSLPYGTFLVNILGSLLIGIVLGWALRQNSNSSSLIIFLTAGFCGGFTTFSSFAHENYILLKNGEIGLFALYAIGSLILGILAVLAGIWFSKVIIPS